MLELEGAPLESFKLEVRRKSSRELGQVHRVLLSFSRFTHSFVSCVGIDAVSLESVTNRPSRIGLDRFFDLCFNVMMMIGAWR